VESIRLVVVSIAIYRGAVVISTRNVTLHRDNHPTNTSSDQIWGDKDDEMQRVLKTGDKILLRS
jgi:hypothetical protein